MRLTRFVAIAVVVLGLVGIVMGAVFIAQGVAKNNELKEAMQVEHITLGLDETAIARGEIVDSLGESQKAGDTVREHRRGIAESYDELLGGERYNPEDPRQLTYAQALNLENYLYLAVAAFGLITVTMASGAFMVITGIALGGTGLVLYRLSGR